MLDMRSTFIDVMILSFKLKHQFYAIRNKITIFLDTRHVD